VGAEREIDKKANQGGVRVVGIINTNTNYNKSIINNQRNKIKTFFLIKNPNIIIILLLFPPRELSSVGMDNT